MYSSRKAEMKKAKRREKQSQVRQALLVNEYIYTKYFSIYQEAANYYNELNNIYPSRPDLRKSDEFRAWKLVTKGEPIRIRKHSKVSYANITIQPTEMPVEMPAEMPVEMPAEMPVEMPAEMPAEMPVEMPAEIPVEMSVEMPAEIPVEMSVERTTKKVMELKIQLLDSSNITETLSVQADEIVQTNPLKVAAEGTIHEETIHPSLTEEIPQEIVDKIVKELREDPELRTIMTDIEQELEFEQIGNELDIFEDTRLEEELENLTW